MYRVIKFFTDLQDNHHAYKVGDVFPRDGADVSNERVLELASSNNKQHTPLIELVDDEPKTKPKKKASKKQNAE